METFTIGDMAVVVKDDVPIAIIIHSGRTRGSNRLDLIWDDESGRTHRVAVKNIMHGIRHLELTMERYGAKKVEPEVDAGDTAKMYARIIV